MPKAITKAKRPLKRVGRKPDGITEAQTVQLEKLLSSHPSTITACTLAGVEERTYYKWIEKADEPDALKIYVQFRQRMRVARQLGKMSKVQIIHTAATGPDGDWRAAAWLLERTHPDEFAPKEKLDVRHTGTVNHEHKAIVFHVPEAISRPRAQRAAIDAHRDPEPPVAP